MYLPSSLPSPPPHYPPPNRSTFPSHQPSRLLPLRHLGASTGTHASAYLSPRRSNILLFRVHFTRTRQLGFLTGRRTPTLDQSMDELPITCPSEALGPFAKKVHLLARCIWCCSVTGSFYIRTG